VDIPKPGTYRTFTEPRYKTNRTGFDIYNVPPNLRSGVTTEAVETGMYPGHGQVTPIVWKNTRATGKGQQSGYRGFGRFPTISEIALQFIATADGLPDDQSYYINNGAPEPIASGGKTAQRIDRDKENDRVWLPAPPGSLNNRAGTRPITDTTYARWYSNLPPFPTMELFRAWGCVEAEKGKGTARDAERHPGWFPQNWNCTLDFNSTNVRNDAALRFPQSGIPLARDEKRIQMAFLLETFVAAAGWTKYAPEFTMVFDGNQISGLQVFAANGQWTSVFDTTSKQAVQSTLVYMGGAKGMTENDNTYPLGGTYGTAALMNGRNVKAIGLKMPKDPGYVDTASGDPHGQMSNFPLVSNYLTVKRDQPLKFRNSGAGRLNIEFYDSHRYTGSAAPVQSITVDLPTGEQETPVPHLVVYSTEKIRTTDSSGNYIEQPAVDACRWWTFNYNGALERYQGGSPFTAQVRANFDGDHPYGRFRSQSHLSITSQGGSRREGTRLPNGTVGARDSGQIPTSGVIYGYSPGGGRFSGVYAKKDDLLAANEPLQEAGENMGTYSFFGTDSVRSLLPSHGDTRLLAAKRNILDGSIWQRHPVWQSHPTALFAHSIMGFNSDTQAGFDPGAHTNDGTPYVDAKNRMVSNAWYALGQVPDGPQSALGSAYASRYRDWDTGPGNMRDGAYINKPDDGNLSRMRLYHGGNAAAIYDTRNAYFTETWLQVPTSGAFATPNRIISSPGVFGSLPTGVWGSRGYDAYTRQHGVPFRTLLFRPNVTVRYTGPGGSQLTENHLGAPQSAGGVSPADHYVMDLFWMPVVEPYLQSHAFSSAGKINLNYQIVPFTYIKRKTGMYAVLKGERVTVVDHRNTRVVQAGSATSSRVAASSANTLMYKRAKNTRDFPHKFWSEDKDLQFHYPINIRLTLTQFDDKFKLSSAEPGMFRSASQICETHLIPTGFASLDNVDRNNIDTKMSEFWQNQGGLTGDNLRERTYANVYGKVTNRSNVFRVHFIAQSIRKSASLAANQFASFSDTITGEYRGSALLERYLNTDSALETWPDFAATPALPANDLEDRYRYRILEMKQFLP
jgi:hypothetical protein